jgi:subtilisin family serine protease
MRFIQIARVRMFAVASLFVGAACASDVTTSPSSVTRSSPNAPSSSRRAARAGADRRVIQLNGTEPARFAAAVAALGGVIERRLPQVNLVVVKGLSDAAAASLASRSEVSQVAVDPSRQCIPSTAGNRMQTMHGTRPPPTPPVDQSGAEFFADFQWNIRVTAADQAWLTTPEGRGAQVYVLDTGIDPDHIDLAGRVDLNKSVSFATNEPNDIRDFESHGTFVSALIASNGIGVASVAPRATLVAVKVLDASGTGTGADLISGIVYAADHGADVINMSFGCFADLTNRDDRILVKHLQAAILYARGRGAVVVAAGGDSATDLRTNPPQLIQIPGELLGVISVGATAPFNQQNFDQIATYSNFGWNGVPLGGVQVFAPGGDLLIGGGINDMIVSACSEYAAFTCGGPSNYTLGTGTSFAAAMVSGEAAVLRSIVGNSVRGSFKSVNCILRGTDVVGPASIYGEGRMNVVKAAKCARH